MTAVRRAIHLCLAVALLAAAARLVERTSAFVTGSLQLDYSAYDTAGEAVRAGLDPYRTWPDRVPPLWDGKSAYRHSRFLYPPLVAFLFAPLSALPYGLAKGLFTLASLLALGAAFVVLTRGLSPVPRAVIALGLATAHPVLTLIDRGQVDAFTLLFVTLAFAPALAGRAPGLAAGTWLAGATLFKLNAVFFAAFWLRRGFRRGLRGFLLGGGMLLVISLVLHGPGPLWDYGCCELPRIARYGEDGPRDLRLSAETMDRLRRDAPEGFVRKDGRLYEVEPFGFVANASLARVLARGMRSRGAPFGATAFSLAIVGAVLILASARRSSGPADELAFLSTATATVLLAGPLTWAMNTVWLLPAASLLARAQRGSGGTKTLARGLLGLGLLLAWLPDQHALPWLYPGWPSLGDYKYVAAEMLVAAGSLIFFRFSDPPTGSPPPTGRAEAG